MIIIVSIAGIGAGLYFLPVTRDLVINTVKDIPVLSNYIKPAEKKVDQTISLEENIKELKKQIETLNTKLRETGNELELARLQIKRKEEAIVNLERELTLIKSGTEQKSKNIKKLASILENMDTKSASRLINNMDEQRAVDVLAQLDKEIAGKILGYLEPSKAVSLFNKLGWGG
jgi:flagellar motility protein MotE (MotC chaperone)